MLVVQDLIDFCEAEERDPNTVKLLVRINEDKFEVDIEEGSRAIENEPFVLYAGDAL